MYISINPGYYSKYNSIYGLISPLLTNLNLGVKILTNRTNSDPCNLWLAIGWLGEWGVEGGELVVPEDGVGGYKEAPGDRLGCSLWGIVCWIIGSVYPLLDRKGRGSGVVLILQEVVEKGYIAHGRSVSSMSPESSRLGMLSSSSTHLKFKVLFSKIFSLLRLS